jgi:hypothetical protein
MLAQSLSVALLKRFIDYERAWSIYYSTPAGGQNDDVRKIKNVFESWR